MPHPLSCGGKEPRVDAEAFAAPTASVIGDVTLGAGASVWYGAVVHGPRSGTTA